MIYHWSTKLDAMSVGERVTEAREAAGLTKTQLAKLCGMSKQALGQIENGTTKAPNPTNLFAIAKATGFSAEWIATGSGKTMTAIDAARGIMEDKNGYNNGDTGISLAPDNTDEPERQNRYQTRRVPVLSRNEIISGKREDNTDRAEFIAPGVSPVAFAFVASEITSPTDRYDNSANDIITVDPDADWEHGKPLLVKDSNDTLMIRRYEVVGKKRYLASHNDRYEPLELDDTFTVIGKVISSQRVY